MNPERGEAATNLLIDSLALRLRPVRPLWAPWLRATTWLGCVALLCLWPILHWSHLDVFVTRMHEPRMGLEALATLLTGSAAIVAAFYLSIPGRSPLWRWAPVPPLIVWLLSAGAGCLRNGFGFGPPGERVGESSHCFMFIVFASVPLALLLSWALRRARPLELRAVAVCGALGVAALAACILQFFHPFDTTGVDLLLHAAAVGVIIVLLNVLRRPALQ